MDGLRLFKGFFVETKTIFLYGLASIITIFWIPSFISPLVSLLILILLITKQVHERPEIDLRSLVRSLISGSIPGYSTFMVMVLFIVYTSWFADFLAESSFYKALASLFFTIGVVPLYAIHIRYNLGTEINKSPKRILISALSKPNGKASLEDMKEAYIRGEKALIELNQEKWHNWVPFLSYTCSIKTGCTSGLSWLAKKANQRN